MSNHFVFAFNQFNVTDPDPCVMPLDSGFSKTYRTEWEALRKVVEPILVADERNLRIVVEFNGASYFIKEMYGAKYNHHYGPYECFILGQAIWG